MITSLPIDLHDSLPSTQDLLRSRLASGDPPAVIRARHQTQGRGRFGKRWDSPSDASLLISVPVPIDAVGHTHAHAWALAAALAVVQTLSEQCGLDAGIRWSNDVMVSGRKIAGILVEAMPGWLLTGIGVNLTQTEFPAGVHATSCLLAAGTAPDTETLLSSLLRQLQDVLSLWQSGDISVFLERWRACDVTGDTAYRLPDGRLGHARGITPDGHLRLQVSGHLMVITAAEPVTHLYQQPHWGDAMNLTAIRSIITAITEDTRNGVPILLNNRDRYGIDIGEYRAQFEGEDDLLHLSITRLDNGPVDWPEARALSALFFAGIPETMIFAKPARCSAHFYLPHDVFLRFPHEDADQGTRT